MYSHMQSHTCTHTCNHPQMLASAQQLSMQQQAYRDEDLIEYNNALRAGIFEAYAGMLNGLPAAMVNQVCVCGWVGGWVGGWGWL